MGRHRCPRVYRDALLGPRCAMPTGRSPPLAGTTPVHDRCRGASGAGDPRSDRLRLGRWRPDRVVRVVPILRLQRRPRHRVRSGRGPASGWPGRRTGPRSRAEPTHPAVGRRTAGRRVRARARSPAGLGCHRGASPAPAATLPRPTDRDAEPAAEPDQPRTPTTPATHRRAPVRVGPGGSSARSSPTRPASGEASLSCTLLPLTVPWLASSTSPGK